jgi:hypothetical protein
VPGALVLMHQSCATVLPRLLGSFVVAAVSHTSRESRPPRAICERLEKVSPVHLPPPPLSETLNLTCAREKLDALALALQFSFAASKREDKTAG